jgi:hypothetical protein
VQSGQKYITSKLTWQSMTIFGVDPVTHFSIINGGYKGIKFKWQNFISKLFVFSVIDYSIYRVRVWLLNTTFNNISVILWQSVLLVEEIGVLGKTHRPAVSHWQILSHNVVSSTPRHERDSNAYIGLCLFGIYEGTF